MLAAIYGTRWYDTVLYRWCPVRNLSGTYTVIWMIVPPRYAIISAALFSELKPGETEKRRRTTSFTHTHTLTLIFTHHSCVRYDTYTQISPLKVVRHFLKNYLRY